MVYSKMIETYSNAIENKFSEISTRYNFDKGEEFEIALCELLLVILPDKYGICRGFVVTETDSFAGDDIIIYDKERFPTLRLLEKQKFDKKQEIPVEAVYAYIEAKHTLHLVNSNNRQSLNKAIEQVGNVKKLQREKRSILSLDSYSRLNSLEFSENRYGWPTYTNPIYGVIISRFVKESSRSVELSSLEMLAKLQMTSLKVNQFVPESNDFLKSQPIANPFDPDLVILGKSNLVYPGLTNGVTENYNSPFLVEGKSVLKYQTFDNFAFAMGIIMLLYALDTIQLDKMPYKKMIIEQFLKK